ncbi:MAG: F0F1 ATP synthase subunit epsilon [Candidatus Omnitrophica bacterium]|nr:F0F1 ATP synthase subunit epsilon [Candidatus Omnitrophota bacterium]
MANPFELEILTPQKRIFKGPVTSLVAPGEIGYLGVLANHAPLVTTLVPGNITYRDPAGSPRTLRSTGSGLLEVYHNTATVLVEAIVE